MHFASDAESLLDELHNVCYTIIREISATIASVAHDPDDDPDDVKKTLLPRSMKNASTSKRPSIWAVFDGEL